MLADFIRDLEALLDPDEKAELVILGSAAIALHGVPFRAVGDLDILPSPSMFEKLAARFPREEHLVGERKVVSLRISPDIEAFSSFPGTVFEEVLQNAARTPLSGSFLVASLDDVIRSKRALGREKDRRDVEAIEAFQRSR